jgi:hypothetical protein
MNNEALVVIVALSLFSVVVMPFVLHFRAEKRKRELDHLERMRAIEVGRAYPGENKYALTSLVPSWAVPSVVALSIGAVVPLGGFLCALVATLVTGYQKEVWMASAMVGLGGVICGTVLAGGAFQMLSSSGAADNVRAYANSKPPVEDDEFDFVRTRG